MIKTNNLIKVFPKHRLVFPDVYVKKGELSLVYGKSGSGKTTFCEILCGFIDRYDGNIIINEKIWEKDKNNFKIFDYIHYVSQFPDNNIIGPTCFTELEFWLYNKKNDIANYKEIIIDTLLEFNLMSDINDTEMLNKPVWKLSFGKKKALSYCAISIVNRPVWILDEPFVGLDVFLKKKIKSKIKHFLESGGTVLCTAHSKNDFLEFNPVMWEFSG